MFEAQATSPAWLKGARALVVLVAVSVGIGACSGNSLRSTAAKAEFVARVAETAASHAVSGNTTPQPAVAAPTGQSAASHATAPSPTASPSASTAPAAAPASGTTATSPTKPALTWTTGPSAIPKNLPYIAPRTHPTVAQVNQAIQEVNKLVPFFTPTPAQVAQVGNQVCTAFDQGQTAAEVDSQALNMVGAGSYSWAVPSSVPAQAVAVVVSLYCPGYTSKL